MALSLFSVNLNGVYIFDDVQIVGTDPRIRQVHLWPQLWTRDYFNGAIDNLYRPLVSQSYAIQWLIHGDRPWAFHLVNILLFAVAAFLVTRLGHALGGLKVAWIAGLLFACHPIHVEAVAEIVGRADELCLIFIVGGLLLFLRRPLTTARAVMISCCIVGAVLSKEQALLFPFLLLAFALCLGWRPSSPAEKQAGLLLTLGACWPVALMIFLREQVLKLPFEWSTYFLDDATQPLVHCTPLNHALMVVIILGRYAQLMICPWKLSIDYGLSVTSSVASFADPYLYAGGAAIVVILIAFGWAIYRCDGIALFCLIAAALLYAMISNIFLIGTVMGEREMFLPSAFFLIWIARYLAQIRPRLLVCFMALAVMLGSWRTISYALRWNDRTSFYIASQKDQPKSVRLCELVSDEWLKAGDLPRAEAAAMQGQQAAPSYWNIWAISGMIAEKKGQYESAYHDYDKAFNLVPTTPIQQARARAIREMKTGQPETQPASN